VSCFGCLIPIRVDQVWEPSDLKGSGRTRLSSTLSVKWLFLDIGSRSDGRDEKEAEELT
jgi:hypothetical protein